MPEGGGRPRLIILADDLTGACDAAAPFAARGVRTEVSLDPSARVGDDAAVHAIDVDTRRLSRRLAVVRTAAAAATVQPEGGMIYKKLDSTLRGHVAAELAACMRVWGTSFAILAPAFPSLGRWVQGGHLYVDGRGDVGGVAELAGFRRGTRLASLGLGTLERGPGESEHLLVDHRRAGASIVVADANAPHHLAVLAEAAARLDPPPLLAGSAGLAAAVADRLGDGPRSASPETGPKSVPAGPWLVMAGSQTDVTGMQVTELARAGAQIIELPVGELLASRRSALAAGREAARALAAGATPVLRLVVSAPLGSVSQRSEKHAGRALGRACRAAVALERPGGLFLTGGLTARACLVALAARGLRLDSEPLRGIALSRAIGGTWDGRPIITKAGGFGAPDAIRRLVMPRPVPSHVES